MLSNFVFMYNSDAMPPMKVKFNYTLINGYL